ncbi:MAG: SDR family NAD(P)-dependent oxidoreductase [Bacteroidota bacterium]
MSKSIVTGAYGAIGQAICYGIAKAGFELTLVGRDISSLEKTRSLLIHRTANQNIFCEAVDLSSQKEIIEFSRRWKGSLHLLVNNAATAPRKRTETDAGIEMQWAANVLGYFWMIRYFHPFMERDTDARIVNVASYWAGGMDLNDPEFKRRPYDNDVAYRQAKQANRMITVAFAERLKSKGITVNSCHPGDVNSKLSNAFGFGGSESPDQGAATPLFLSLSEQVNGITGKYFEHGSEVRCQFSADKNQVEALYSLCEKTLI